MVVGGDVFDPFAKIWPHMKVKKDYIWTDNWVFLLHRKWSFIFSLLGLLSILGYVAILEEPIVCVGPTKDIPESYMNFFCWVWGTYIVPEYLTSGVDNSDGIEYRRKVPHPGVGQEFPNTTRRYTSHYAFFPIMYLLQTLSFRFIKYLWSYLEGERLKTLLSELSSPTVPLDTMNDRIARVCNYMTTYPVTFLKKYGYNYAFCECLNLVNILLQYFIFNLVLHKEYYSYGLDVLQYLTEGPPTYHSPFDRMFPKVTKCEIEKYGPSGTEERREALCILPLHNFAEKIFLASWFWLLVLGIITALNLIYRLIVVTSPKARYWVLKFKTRNTGVDPRWLRYFVANSNYGTWFVLSLLQKNMTPWVFKNFMKELHDKMREVSSKDL